VPKPHAEVMCSNMADFNPNLYTVTKHIKNFKMCTLYVSLIGPKFTSFWRHSLLSQWNLQVYKF